MPDLAAIRDWVRTETLLEEDDLADSKINAIINQGLRRISTMFRWPWLQESTTFTTTAGTQGYALPSDATFIESVSKQGETTRLREITAAKAWEQWGSNPPDGEPKLFYIWKNEFKLVPVPTESNVVYDVHYYEQPTTLDDDTDTPAFDSQFHMVLAEYAISKAWEREEDFTKRDAAMSAFERIVEEMARYYLDRASDAPWIFGEGADYRSGLTPPGLPWIEVTA